MSVSLQEADLPGLWYDADRRSLAGQRWVLGYSAVRLGGVLLAALGGVAAWRTTGADAGALIVALGFLVALASELALWAHSAENIWYRGRALAESAKTLAWRYAVAAEPFPPDMTEGAATEKLRSRLREMSAKVAPGVVSETVRPVATNGMRDLRRASFEDRRAAYLVGRTRDQQNWYSSKANRNQRLASRWRVFLICAEVVAVILACLRVFTGWSIDLAGLLSAIIAAGAAWAALRQYSALSAAYSVAAMELGLQSDRLAETAESEWPQAVAEAEEAISREHTLWLASRAQ